MILEPAPEERPVTTAGELDRERRAPGAGTHDDDVVAVRTGLCRAGGQT